MKTSLKFQLQTKIRPLAIFYVVIYSLILLDRLSLMHIGFYTGIELSAMIFVFIAGITSFKEEFNMLQQNGKTRKELFLGAVLCFMIVSSILTLLNLLTVEALMTYTNYSIGHYGLIFYMYRSIIVYSVIAISGYFIATLYYRMNKAANIGVSVSVPILLSIVYSWVDGYLLKGKLHYVFVQTMDFTQFDLDIMPFAVFSLLTLLFVIAVSWLLVRRAAVKV